MGVCLPLEPSLLQVGHREDPKSSRKQLIAAQLCSESQRYHTLQMVKILSKPRPHTDQEMPIMFWQRADPGYYEECALHPEVRQMGS